MPGNGENLQVVFLIDTRTYNKDNSALINNKPICLSKTLSLSALKILQSLVSLEGGGGTTGTDEFEGRVRSIRWGYKFFNSLKPCSGYRYRDFHDFNLANFEKFEDELRNKFKDGTKQNESSAGGSGQTSKQKNTPGLKVWSQDYAPADHLAVSLCEVAQDFQWQAPDIMSPTRGSCSSSSSSAVTEKTNLTFLFMACPWNEEDLKEFVKMRSNQITTNDLLEVVVHDDVRTDFLEKHHVKLIWFDTKIAAFHKLGMMEAISGHLIPLNAILSTGSEVTSSISSILRPARVEESAPSHSAKYDEKPKARDAKRFEHFSTTSNCMMVSSVMDYAFCKSRLLKQSLRQESAITAPLYLTKGCGYDLICCLKIKPLSRNRMFSDSIFTGESSSAANKSKELQSTNKEEPPTEITDGIEIIVRGQLVRDQMPLRYLRSKSVYCCLGVVPTPKSETAAREAGDGACDEDQLSNRFSSLLQQLARNNKVLVVDVCHSDWLTSLLGMLEPFTASSASLRLVSPSSAINRQTILDAGITFGKSDQLANPLERFLKESVMVDEEDTGTRKTTTGSKADCLVGVQHLDVRPFRPYQLESWYRSAPSSGVNSQYITQLTSIQGDNSNSMATGLGEVMMNLRDFYCKDPAVLGKSTLPSSHDKPQTSKVASGASNKLKNKKKKLIRAKSFGGINTSRTGIILENSKKLLKNKSNELESKEEEGKKERTAQKEKPTVNINEILAEVSSSEDLLKHFKDNYEKQLQQDSCPCLFAQTIVSISNHYIKIQQDDRDTIQETKKLIQNSVIMTNKQLRKKYQKDGHQASVEERIREVTLQVVLQLEMEALSPTDITSKKSGDSLLKKADDGSTDDEKESELPDSLQDVVDEMVAMLQTIPFLADHNKLTMFLKEKLLPNYSDTVPYMLVGIYEGLMQPVPSTLCSPNIEDLMSIQPPPSSASYGSVSSLEAAGSVPNRPRGLKRLPSIASIPTRTIAVGVKKNENKPKETSERRVKKKPVVEEAKKVRRNLFMGGQDNEVESKTRLSRRKSVAVMQTTQSWKSPRRSGRGCSRTGVTLKTKTVKETPGKRQVICAMLEKMERARQKADKPETLVQIIEESPEKPVRETDTKGIRSSPRIKASNKLQRTKSFYSKSNNKTSRNLAKALTLSARIRGDDAKMPPRITRLTEHASNINKSKDDEIVQESPSKFLFSEIFSPEKLLGIRKIPLQGADSPSHNTRQRITLTPIKQESNSGFKKCLAFSPAKVKQDPIILKTGCLPSDNNSELSPFKSPIGTPLRTPRKRRHSSRHGSAEKPKQLETFYSENQETGEYITVKKPDIANHAFESSVLKKIESPSNSKQSKIRISPRVKSDTLDNWPRKKFRSGTLSPTAYKTPSPSRKGGICTKASPVWIEMHQKSPTFAKVTPKSESSGSGSSDKKVIGSLSNSCTRLTRSNSTSKQRPDAMEVKNENPPKSRRRLCTSRQSPISSKTIHCSFSSSAEDDEELIPFADQLFAVNDCPEVVGLISTKGLDDSDSDPEIDFPKHHLNDIQNETSQTLLTPNYGLRRKRSREDNSSEKPHKISRKKTPDFRNAGSSFECYKSIPATISCAPECAAESSAANQPPLICNTLQIPSRGISSNNLTTFRKPSRKKTQNMPSTSGRSAFSSCGIDLSCSEISNFSSIDGDEVFTEESMSQETKDKSYKSPGGTPNRKHTPLSVRGLSQLLSSPLVSPSQRKSFGEERRMSRRGTLLNFSPK